MRNEIYCGELLFYFIAMFDYLAEDKLIKLVPVFNFYSKLSSKF